MSQRTFFEWSPFSTIQRESFDLREIMGLGSTETILVDVGGKMV
jgi:hypothetical protein